MNTDEHKDHQIDDVVVGMLLRMDKNSGDFIDMELYHVPAPIFLCDKRRVESLCEHLMISH